MLLLYTRHPSHTTRPPADPERCGVAVVDDEDRIRQCPGRARYAAFDHFGRAIVVCGVHSRARP